MVVDTRGAEEAWRLLQPDEALDGHRRFLAGVEALARASGAVHLLDGVLLLSASEEAPPAPLRAVVTARQLWERTRIDLNLPVRIAVAATGSSWSADRDAVSRHPVIEECRMLAAMAPPDAILLTDDVYLVMVAEMRRQTSPAQRVGAAPSGRIEAMLRKVVALGFAGPSGVPTYGFPASAIERGDLAGFPGRGELDLWDAFRRYTTSAEVRMLRYVGLRPARKEPPALAVEDVFVPLEVHRQERRTSRAAVGDARRARGEKQAGTTVLEETEDERLRAVPFADELTGFETGSPESFDRVFRDARGLIVLGDPGAGKTTLLRWLAVVAAGGRPALSAALGCAERLLPLPVSVGTLADVRRDIGPAASVIDTLSRYFHARDVGDEVRLRAFLGARLDAGDCLILLDGLDEVAAAQRVEIRAWLEAFVALHPSNRFVISSRHTGFTGFRFRGSTVVSLNPFGPDQVERYVRAFTAAYRRWETNGEVDAAREHAIAEDLLRAIHGSPRLAAVARNPFMLSSLSLVHRAEGRLPRHRVQFYDHVARALCETWEKARRLVAKDHMPSLRFEEEAIPVLGDLALAMHAAYPGVAPVRFVIDTLAHTLMAKRGVPAPQAREVAQEFLRRAGDEAQILVERGAGRWGFLHATFQEFFVAAGLNAQERLTWDELSSRLFDPRWEEILRLGIGHLAIVQNRSEAARRFVHAVLRHRERALRGALNRVIRRHEMVSALLAVEAGESLSPDVLRAVAQRFTAWVLDMPSDLTEWPLGEVGSTDFGQYVVTESLAALRGADPDVRARAAVALGRIGTDAAIQPLREALRDAAWLVRASAATAIGSIGDVSALSALTEALHDQDWRVRGDAAEGLGKLGIDAVIPYLVEALGDELYDVGVKAAEALGEVGSEAAVDAALNALGSPNPTLRHLAAAALSEMGSHRAVPALVRALEDQDADVRCSAVFALEAVGDKEAFEAFLRAVNDSSDTVRASAAAALGRTGSEAALPDLLTILDDPSAHVRENAAAALGELGIRSAARSLLRALNDSDWAVRAQAAEALGRLHATSALPALRQSLRDNHERVRACATSAIGVIGGERASSALMHAVKDPSAEVRVRAAAALGIRGVAELVLLLRHKNSFIREQSADALGRLGIPAAIPPLVRSAAKWKKAGREWDWRSGAMALWRISQSPQFEAETRPVRGVSSEATRGRQRRPRPP
ncbi:MAG TPA: HEAT repeat domain-containing protein [Candidatus Acidoferrum sp.]|nr:HEAT repeat domain-containing protein [Candidatus Acidoferrum sp.]